MYFSWKERKISTQCSLSLSLSLSCAAEKHWCGLAYEFCLEHIAQSSCFQGPKAHYVQGVQNRPDVNIVKAEIQAVTEVKGE